MNRLTARNKRFPKEAYYPYCFQNDTCDGQGPSDKCDKCPLPYHICETLADYEDTGLTPEQIISIATELKEYKQLELSPKRLSEHIAFCRRYHELFGAIDFNRLMELKERVTAKRVLLINGGIPVCPECGAKVLKHYTFCKDCGQKLDQ